MRWMSVTALVCIAALGMAGAQNTLQMYVTANANYYLPRNSDKQVYPIIAFDSDGDAKVLLGGFGAGFTIVKPLNEKFLWRAQINTSRRVYWNDPMLFTDNGGAAVGMVALKGIDIVTDLTATAHYRLGNRLSVGTGLGMDILHHSYMRLPHIFVEPTIMQNRYNRPIIPLLPVVLSYGLNKMLFSVHYKLALISKSKSSLSEFYKDSYSVLSFEVGYRINR